MAEVTLTLEEYEALREMAMGGREVVSEVSEYMVIIAPLKRKPSAYNLRYSKAFKSIQNDFKKKDGSWKANGFKRAAAAARKLAKK